jgi:hypothetical protein
VAVNVWTWLGHLNWTAIGGVCAVLGVVGGLAKWIVTEIRKNRVVIGQVKTKVTTPNTVAGSIGETVAQVSLDIERHDRLDDDRFSRIWQELGKQEPLRKDRPA